MSFTQTRQYYAWQLNGYGSYVTQRTIRRLFRVHGDPFESQLWLRNRKGKLREESKIADSEMEEKTFCPIQSTILFSILINIRFFLFPGDEFGRLCSTRLLHHEGVLWLVHCDPPFFHCSGKKLFPQRSICCCTILLFLFTEASMLRNFTRVESCVDSFLDPTCVPVSITKF